MKITNLVGSPIKIGKIEISEFDFEKSTWLKAKEISKFIGDNWRLPTIKEVADLALFLCSESASGITGQSINIDCGVLPN